MTSSAGRVPPSAAGVAVLLIATLGSLSAAAQPDGSGAAPDRSGVTVRCDSRSCFSERFARCHPAAYRTRSRFAGQAQYRIEGAADGGCRVRMTYRSNPNPAWTGQPLEMTLDAGRAFAPQVTMAVAYCLAHDAPGPWHCGGPLRGVAARVRTGATGADGGDALQPAVEPPCGHPVEDAGEPLFRLRRGQRWGYVDRRGKWVIAPHWARVTPFSEARASVFDGRRWTVIDARGNRIVSGLEPPNGGGVRVGAFHEGCAAVRPTFAEHHAWFLSRDGRSWLRDRLPGALAGKNVDQFGPYSAGLARFRLLVRGEPARFGYIDAQGRTAVAPRALRAAGRFSENLAPVALRYQAWGYIDASGGRAFPGKFTLEGARAFSGGLAAVRRHGKWGYVDTEGRFVIEPAYTSAGDFAEGLAGVTTGPWPHETLVYIDRTGRVKLRPEAVAGFTICHPDGAASHTFRDGLVRLEVAASEPACRASGAATAAGPRVYPHVVYLDRHGRVVIEGPPMVPRTPR